MRLYPTRVNILEALQMKNEYGGKSPYLELLCDLLIGLTLSTVDLVLFSQILFLGEGLQTLCESYWLSSFSSALHDASVLHPAPLLGGQVAEMKRCWVPVDCEE